MMIETIDDICSKLSEGIYYNEEHVRVCIVLRLLNELGWDIWNPTEVNTEYKPVRYEDATRVDIALFCNSFSPAVFIEVKAVGRIEGELARIEQQLRDYNRNNTAEFSFITDGQKWRLYYSQTGGEFSQKCFKTFDLLEEETEDIARFLQLFLSKEKLVNGEGRQEATTYLRLSQRQRALEDSFPKAKRISQEPPFPRLPDALMNLMRQAGFDISEPEATSFITDATTRPTPVEESPRTNIVQPLSNGATRRRRRSGIKIPPDGTKCRFRYAGETYNGTIRAQRFHVDSYGVFGSLSQASVKITDTSRNGWRDWELQLPNSNDWILAQTWRDKQE
ncbi:MAG: type I restriction enzyme HsdR N-terminal domain-containing protein [Ignavibacteriae bacterium]|nr:type I restriction enzyme HsdR N-terminal domain-containing protein [Ignavibacteriota bacterium]